MLASIRSSDHQVVGLGLGASTCLWEASAFWVSDSVEGTSVASESESVVLLMISARKARTLGDAGVALLFFALTAIIEL